MHYVIVGILVSASPLKELQPYSETFFGVTRAVLTGVKSVKRLLIAC